MAVRSEAAIVFYTFFLFALHVRLFNWLFRTLCGGWMNLLPTFFNGWLRKRKSLRLNTITLISLLLIGLSPLKISLSHTNEKGLKVKQRILLSEGFSQVPLQVMMNDLNLAFLKPLQICTVLDTQFQHRTYSNRSGV